MIRVELETLAAGVAGVAVFWWLGLPAASVSGAMVGGALLLVGGRSLHMRASLRDLGMLIGGITMGSSVTPEMIAAATRYPASLALFGITLVLTILGTQAFLRQVGRLDRHTAFFASAPGALSAVLAVAAETRANLLQVTIIQSFRLFVLVALLPSLVIATGGGGHASTPTVASPQGLIALFFLGGAMAFALARLGMAAPWIFGGMLVSAVLHGLGIVVGGLPVWLGEVGYALVGIFIATRFSTVTRGLLMSTFWLSLGAFVVSLLIAVIGAALAARVVDVPFGQSLVAFAPGGLEAMVILGVSLGLDPLYVGLHHLMRFFSIALLIPLALPLLRRFGGDEKPPDSEIR